MEEYKLRRLVESDIEYLVPIMKRAFDLDSNMYLGTDGGPDGYDDGSFLKKYALNPKSTAYCVMENNQYIGAIILWINANKENYLGCIFIDPSVEGKGIGTRLWNRIEGLYPDTLVWRTETPAFSRKNHNFYINKCGFHLVRIENPKSFEDGNYKLEKRMK